jgi:hypothetical protein
MKRRAIQTSQYSTAILESSQVTPSHLEDSIPKSNKHDEIVEGEGEVLLLESVAHSRERGRGAQDLDSKGSSAFSEWPTALRGRWGSIYIPHLKRAIGESFHRISPVELSGSPSGPY